MKHAPFITTLAVDGVPGAKGEEVHLCVYYDPISHGIFGIDASFVDQVSAVVMNPMQNRPEFLLLSEGEAGGDSSVDEESVAEFFAAVKKHPIIKMMRLMSALHEMAENRASNFSQSVMFLQIFEYLNTKFGISKEDFTELATMAKTCMEEINLPVNS